MATRWAICGAGKISWDFCTAIRTLPKEEHEIVAIAARDGKRAADFAKKFDIAASFDNYDKLAQLNNADVIYIGVIHPVHVELCLKYIEAGKNIVCEKPMAMTTEGTMKVIEAAKDKNVFFLEAYWTRFFPAYRFLREQVNSGLIGDLKMVEVSFCQTALHAARVSKKDLGGGVLLDFGCYPVQIANNFFKGKPEAVQSMLKVSEDEKVDTMGVIQLRYSGGRFASLVFSGETGMGDNFLILRGTKGNLKISDHCWNPDHVILPNGDRKDFPFPSPDGKDPFNYTNSIGLIYEIQCVRECLKKGLCESELMSHEDSIIISEIMQEALQSHGIHYDTL